VVLGHMEGRAKATGTQVKVPFAHVWRMSGGKVRRGQALTDTAVVAEALRRWSRPPALRRHWTHPDLRAEV
jgi:ketosteroid isomerase-like protein